MRIGVTIKGSRDFQSAKEAAKILASIVTNERLRLLKKGLVVWDWKLQTGEDRNDFVENKFTAIMYGQSIKAPRIITRHLIKRHSKKVA